MSRPVDTINQTKRRAVFDAAVALLAERGPGTTLTDVGKRSGVSWQTLYNHFAGKAELLNGRLAVDQPAQAAALFLNMVIARPQLEIIQGAGGDRGSLAPLRAAARQGIRPGTDLYRLPPRPGGAPHRRGRLPGHASVSTPFWKRSRRDE